MPSILDIPSGTAEDDSRELFATDLSLVIACSISILILIYVGLRFKVYRNYSSMLMISVLILAQVDEVIMASLRLIEYF